MRVATPALHNGAVKGWRPQITQDPDLRRADLHSDGDACHDTRVISEELEEEHAHHNRAARTHRQPHRRIVHEVRHVEVARLRKRTRFTSETATGSTPMIPAGSQLSGLVEILSI